MVRYARIEPAPIIQLLACACYENRSFWGGSDNKMRNMTRSATLTVKTKILSWPVLLVGSGRLLVGGGHLVGVAGQLSRVLDMLLPHTLQVDHQVGLEDRFGFNTWERKKSRLKNSPKLLCYFWQNEKSEEEKMFGGQVWIQRSN